MRWVWIALSFALIAFASYGSAPLMDWAYTHDVWIGDYHLFHKWLNLHNWALHASALCALKSGWARSTGRAALFIGVPIAALWGDFGHRLLGIWWIDQSDWWLLAWEAGAFALYFIKHRKAIFKWD